MHIFRQLKSYWSEYRSHKKYKQIKHRQNKNDRCSNNFVSIANVRGRMIDMIF